MNTATTEARPADVIGSWRLRLRALYNRSLSSGSRFRYALLLFDIVTVAFIITTSFLPASDTSKLIDAIFAVIIAADFAVRLFISRQPWREFTRLSTWTDLIAFASLLAPLAGISGGFLRVLRTLRLLRNYQMLQRLREDFPLFRRREDIVMAMANLAVFIFLMTSVVYETQKNAHPQINNYADALYFTVTALTTTGFGDIVLPGTLGRLITVAIMIFGVTLFLNLARALIAPLKVRHPCPTCALQRHDADAVHCKACGTVLNIPNEGL